MSVKLFFSAVSKFILGVLLVGVLIFFPAGTLSYANGWLMMCLLFIPIFLAGIVLMVKNPMLLKSRLGSREKQKDQGAPVRLSALMFLVGFMIAGLGKRFDWYMLPPWVVIVASAVFLLAYLLYAEVLRENTYLSRIIEVQKGQKVISSGLYGIVRHPMYLATLLMFLPMPLILGSFWGLIPFTLYPIVTVIRILNEEKVLTDGLEGYAEYKTKVKYRLFPLVW